MIFQTYCKIQMQSNINHKRQELEDEDCSSINRTSKTKIEEPLQKKLAHRFIKKG
uniref:Uncharacterized protein n=1 Tax=Arundo donax TaxID=35708 RepID=A0A0A9BQU2_ARUDO